MEIFGSDVIIGDFRASDFGLTLGSIDYDGTSEDGMGNDITIAEQFVGRNPIPVYLDYTYAEKLKPTITLVRDDCRYPKNMDISEFEIRGILRLLTGTKGYQWMKVITEEDSEDTWYRVKVISTALLRYPTVNVGIKIYMECDSQFGYSPIQTIKKTVTAYNAFNLINNSDDIYTYLYPTVEITMSTAGNLQIVNNTEEWTTVINNVVSGEVITIDSEKEIITSTETHDATVLDDFNLHWIRMISGRNEYITNLDCSLVITYRLRRKGGFICR